LLNLCIEQSSINKVLSKQIKKPDGLLVKEAEPGTLKTTLAATPSILKMTEKTTPSLTVLDGSTNITSPIDSPPSTSTTISYPSNGDVESNSENKNGLNSPFSMSSFNSNDFNNTQNSIKTKTIQKSDYSSIFTSNDDWQATTEWAHNWKYKLPLQTIMRLLQVLVPQVEKICIDKNLTDESEILKFLQHGTLVGLLPVPHPILIRKYQPNHGTAMWFRTYIWGVIYLRYRMF
jgi:hypothetical protein